VKRTKRTFAVIAALALVAVGATAATVSASGAKTGKSLAGGTYTVGVESTFGYTSGLDPTGEYAGDYLGVIANLLVRTLVGTKHVGGADGNALVPDMATSLPKPTNGGKTYTFKLKSGLKFGPPVSRAVTSKDFVTAFQRIAKPKNGAQYGFYYSVIKGFDDYSKGKAKTISGITTPNNSTIVFNLTTPTVDFLFRLLMPATGPLPAEVTKCFEGKANVYGKNIVSTGPYMLEGSDSLDASSCSALKPASGHTQTNITLVRNPDYAKSTDSTRENNPDKFEFVVNSNTDDIYNKTKAGDYDDQIATEPAKVIREYTTSSSLKSRFKSNLGDRTWYITMNTTQPPFDDIHVRKAMNWVMDKDGIRKVWGGPTAGDIGTHIAPPTILGGLLASYDPYKTPGAKGSVAKAKAEMRQSVYDTNQDGTCDASECSGVILVTDTRGVDPGMAAVIQDSAKKIGISFTIRQIKGAYPSIQTPSNNIPAASRPGWGKDYADAGTFFDPLFDGRTIISAGNTNYSLIGITQAKANELKVKGNLAKVPSVNSKIDACKPKVGAARNACYAALDKYLMTSVVPWVPWLFANTAYVTGPNVTKWSYDQQWTTPAYSRVAVKS
jgi:peptide/nickel transport system substrate-binding protein